MPIHPASPPAPHPVVAQLGSGFFALTEVFMYFYISRCRLTRPVCLSWQPPVNLDQFPFDPKDVYYVLRKHRVVSAALSLVLRRRIHRTREAVRILRARDARLLHAHYGPVGGWALALKRRLGLPLITTFYGYDLAPALIVDNVRWAGERRRLFRAGDLFLVEGPFMRQRLIELGCPADKVEIQRIAIDLPSIVPRVAAGPGAPLRILFAGRWVEKKGLSYALDAVRQILQAGHSVTFTVIGDGPLRTEIHRQAADLAGAVRFLGLLDRRDYLAQLAQADVFLHPSVTTAQGDTEGGAPTSILDAQAAGLAVVATTHADIPHVTVPGQSALLAPERDAAGLAQALETFVRQPELIERFGAAGREFIRQHHDIEREAERLEQRYLQLIHLSNPDPVG